MLYVPPSMNLVKFQTTWGTITLTLDGDQAVALNLPFLKNTPRQPFAVSGKSTSPAKFFQGLEGRIPRVEIPAGTQFQRAVWRELKKIPRGQTQTYGAIAARIGQPNAARAVGAACGANPLPIFIPCHRVVAANGLGGFSGGLPWKKLLLSLETTPE